MCVQAMCVYVSVCLFEKERDKQTARDRDRETATDRDGERETVTDRDRE